MLEAMKAIAALLLILVLSPAIAQPGRGRGDPGRSGDPGRYMQRDYGRPISPGRYMPPPERRLSWEDRQRLREQVRGGNMTRDEARERWREQRGFEPGRSPEERQRLRRDIQDWNRDLERR
jgi:hypothetical protein